MNLIGHIRLGRNADLRLTPDGKPVLNFAGAYNYGMKDASGARPTQWIECALWGDRAERLAEYFTKGAALVVTLNDVHIETFTRRDNTLGSKLVGRVIDFTFAGKSDSSGSQPAAQASPQTRVAPPAAVDTGIDDDEIPF